MAANPIMANFPGLQLAVHEMIEAVGGYWSPAAGVLRLMEELGELAEQISVRNDEVSPELVEEIADIWIITTCTANQFLINLSSPHQTGEAPIKLTREADSYLRTLMIDAGIIARLVNYYDGPKAPKELVGWTSLGETIRRFQGTLTVLARSLDADLESAVLEKTRRSITRDAGRFPIRNDPSMASSVIQFSPTVLNSPCTFAPQARIWGAPDWSEGLSPYQHVTGFKSDFLTFAKCAEHEGLDGFVVAHSPTARPSSVNELGRWFARLTKALLAFDPKPDPNILTSPDTRGWQFQFGGVRMFVSVFSDIYPTGHPRRTKVGSFAFFQPETSFSDRNIGSKFEASENIKDSIRRRFRRRGFEYPAELIDRRIEAHIYVLPMRPDEPPVQWWTFPDEPLD
ncbi:YqcI/YcgG family protein [Actinoplanes philippinensis]|uniref:YqcI/YcgG family protein n=1 Tax=Actinoplanes philippinensis TaxID=35752 RepID=UPI0033F16E6F